MDGNDQAEMILLLILEVKFEEMERKWDQKNVMIMILMITMDALVCELKKQDGPVQVEI